MAVKLFTMCIMKVAAVTHPKSSQHKGRNGGTVVGAWLLQERVKRLQLTRSQTCKQMKPHPVFFRVAVRGGKMLGVVAVRGCVFHASYVIWQFVNHDSDFEKTKLKLLDAANLVDKVRPREALRG